VITTRRLLDPVSTTDTRNPQGIPKNLARQGAAAQGFDARCAWSEVQKSLMSSIG
jgi:hypothetical protein